MKKRWMAMLLTILMLFEWLPLQAFATADQENATVQDDLSVEGTSGLGMLLAADITEEQAEMAESTGCGVLRLEISGNTAEVELRTITDAVLLVAIYTEDGRQLLASGKTEVCTDDTEAAVTIEGEMPDYFMASAYLLGAADASLLCTPYETPMYTRGMRELLDSTVSDYEEDQVLNLDENEESNFAVYAEETVVVESQAGVNTVALADDENRTYMIENADEQFLGLETGDIVAYPYEDGNILILKVASMTAEGSTVTIEGAELEMEEVFAYVKIEGESTTADAVVDDSAAMEGIEYVGMEAEDDGPALFAASGGSTTVLTHKYNIALQKNVPSEHLDLTGSLNGTLKIRIPVSMNYYIAQTQIHLEFRADPTVTWSFSFKGSVKGKMPLGKIHVYPVPGVAVGFSPDLVLEMEGEVVTHNVTQSTIGMVYDNKTGFQNLTTAPTTDSDTQLEAELFFGIDFGPELKVLGPIAEVSFSAVVGINIEAEDIGTGGKAQAATGPYQHSCEKCMHMELTFKVEFGAELSFLNGLLVYSAQRRTSTGVLGTAYYSFDHEDFGFGSCPYVAYRVTLCVQDKNGNPISGAQTVAYGGGDWGCTNKNGVAVVYAVPRIYDITTTVGDEVISNTIAVIQPTKIIITPDGKAAVSSAGGDDTTITDYLQIQGESFVDQSGGVQSSGQCGADVRWTYRKTGVLVIYGSGPMYNYSYLNGDGTPAPWKSYRSKIKSVVIQDGVTHIGDGAFYDCGVLESVHIPDSVTGLGRYAFSDCISLTDVVIPGSVGQIYAYCFAGCQSLRNVTIEEGVETLAGWCFEGTALESVTIPDSVTVIAGSAFNACRQLRAVHLGSGHSGWINGAFPKCPNLEMITVATDNPYCTAADGVVVSRDGTTLIGLVPTHSGRYEVPAGIKTIGSGAFQNCEGLTEIVLPEEITVIENHTFNSCTALTAVTIPEGVTAIGHYAFRNCTALTTMYLPATIRVIGTYAMEGAGLTDVYYGGTAAQWNEIERHTLSDWGGVVIHFADGEAVSVLSEEEAPAEIETDPETQDDVQLMSLHPGEHESTYDGGIIVRRADFSDLMPGVDYIMLCLADMEGEDLLAADNLLYVKQGTADADGRLSFTYIQRVEVDPSYVLACGPTRRMGDAGVTFPEMYADGESHLVIPEVRYDGELLTENVDYVLLGDVDYTDAGEYTVVVHGIGEYTGEAEYTYTVLERISVEDMEITFSEMTAVGGTYPVAIRVQYDGTELVMGTDYTLSGDVEYSAAGDYTVTVHGMGRYTGTVECGYTVYPAGGFAMDVRTGEDGSVELWLAFYDASLPEGAVILMPAAAYDSVTGQMLSCDLLTLDHQTNMKNLSLHLYAGMEHEKITWKIFFLLEGGSYLPGEAYLTDEIDRTK